MVLTNLEDYTFWANSLSEYPNNFDFSTLLHDDTQWKLDAVDQHNAVKSDASGNSTSQSGTSRTESQDPNANSFTGTFTGGQAYNTTPPWFSTPSFDPRKPDSTSLQHASPQDDTMGYISPSSPFAYTGSVQGPDITVLSSVPSGTLGSFVMAQGMPTWVDRQPQIPYQAQPHFSAQLSGSTTFSAPAQPLTTNPPAMTESLPPQTIIAATVLASQNRVPVPASWAPVRSLINPGPFAFNDIFHQINPLFSVGALQRPGQRSDLRAAYSIATYGRLDLVRQESGGKFGVELFQRVYEVNVSVKVDARVRLQARECLIQVFQCMPDDMMWHQVYMAGRPGAQAPCEELHPVEKLWVGVNLSLGAGAKKSHIDYRGIDQKRVILICRLVFPDYTSIWTNMFGIDGKDVERSSGFAMI